uniref:Cry32Eb-like protein n=1 Tax=Bacillus thuringiensis TaxID=1428 RepID=A0A1Q1NKN8_BACTU|nr:Cry32Eb-like protein [Bacillus thuringiensis]
MNQDVTRAREAVNTLFLNDALQLKVTDYQVDQAAKLVECISDPIHTKEKMCLLEQVKMAKRLSQARNLLHHGDFESPDWSGENRWKISNHVYVTSDNPIFKGRYLNMPNANTPQFSDKIFPSYAYQKIDESKLKPYTRYMVRGFVGNSKDLELLVARYDKEVHKKMNVPNDILPTDPCTGGYLLEQGSYPVLTNQMMPQNMSCDTGYRNEVGTMVPNTSMMCPDPHTFQFHLDIGELDMDRNLGIWVGFKIGTTDGMAKLDHVEVVEVGPLTGDALTRMKKREQKWQKKWAEKRMRIKGAVQIARDAIQMLFTDSNQNRLQSAITLKQILEAETWVQKIPYVYNQFLQRALPVVPGETYDIFLQLSDAINIARALYDQRNALVNGDFSARLSNWNGTEGADVQQIGNASVLVISDWSASISQHVCVHPEHSYLLRVTARKEGSGEGYVTISDGTEENTETLKFIADEKATSPVSSNVFPTLRECYNERNMQMPEAYGTSEYASNQNIMNYPSESYRGNAYPGATNMNYQSESFGFTPYSEENSKMSYASNHYKMGAYPDKINMPVNQGLDCRCGCSTDAYPGENMMNNYPSDMYETNAYSNNMTNKQGMGCGCYYSNDENPMMEQNIPELSGYITKTMKIFPETNRVCIEIGETSGTFQVESIELIRMDGE